MNGNKSIDGLSTRRSKSATVSTSKKVTKPQSSASTITHAPKTTTSKASQTKSSQPKISQSKPAQIKQPVPKPTKLVKPIEKPTPKTESDITEDFLKPIQAFDFDENSGELKVATEPIESPTRKKRSKKQPTNRKRKIITRAIIGIVFVLILAIIICILYINGIIAKITNNQGNFFDLFSETYVPLKTDDNGRTNILAFGTSGYDMSGTEGESVHDGAQLTDSIMIISLNQETGDVAMISLPRDLKISSTCTGTGKINEVYWCNNTDGTDEAAGANALMDEVSHILDIDFQYYAHLNWGSLVQIVDALDGINVTLDEDVHDYYIFDAGIEYHLNGEEALRLARTRYGTTHGDFSRGASQQKILIGIKNRIFEKELSLPDIISLANTLGDNLRVNLSVDEIKTLAHLTSSFDFNNMRQISLIEPENYMTTDTINGISYVLPLEGEGNYNDIIAFIKKSLSNDPKVYEDPSVLVLNSTGTPGLAATEQTALEQAGYANIYINDLPDSEFTENYLIYDLSGKKSGTKKLLEEKYQTTAHPAEELPAGIETECDFVIIIGNQKAEEEE